MDLNFYTAHREIAVLKHMFEFAVDEGVLKVNPIVRLKKLKEYREERPRLKQEDFLKREMEAAGGCFAPLR